jgi:NAD(P)-dependent dehydrogenase (short-subunit alcohol dehydrogenase family)
LFLHGHVCLLSDRKSEGRGDNDHERAAIHHAKILRLFGRHVERLEQAFREGASVAVVDVDEAGVHAVVKEITASGGKAKGIVADLREDANARRIVRETANAFGGLDFVRNHLGHPGPASVDGIEMADFALAVDLDLRSQIVATEAVLPELRARSGGGLLYTVSTSGLVGSQFSPVYSAVKFGVVGFVRALARRVAKDEIRVNAICPGATDTPMLRVFVARPDRQSTMDQAVEDARCGVAVVSQGGEEGQRPPVAMRHGRAQWHTATPRSRNVSNSACSVRSGVCDSWPSSQSRFPSSGYGRLP